MTLRTPRRAVVQSHLASHDSTPGLEPSQLLDLRAEETPYFSQEIGSTFTTFPSSSSIGMLPVETGAKEPNTRHVESATVPAAPPTTHVVVQSPPPPVAVQNIPSWLSQGVATLVAGILVLAAARLMAPRPETTAPFDAMPRLGYAMPVMVAPIGPVGQTSLDPAPVKKIAANELLPLPAELGAAPPEEILPTSSVIAPEEYPSTEYHTLIAQRPESLSSLPLPFIESDETATSIRPSSVDTAATIKLDGRIEPYRNE